MTTYLKLTDILGIDDAQYLEVHVPEWNGHVKLKSMTSVDRDRYETLVMRLKNDASGNSKGWEGLRARVVANCLCDDAGRRLFPSDSQDWKKLNEKSAAVISRLFDQCMTLSGMGEEAEGESEGTLTLPG